MPHSRAELDALDAVRRMAGTLQSIAEGLDAIRDELVELNSSVIMLAVATAYPKQQ